QPDGGAGVGAQRELAETGGEGRGGACRRAARGLSGMSRVETRSVELVRPEDAPRELGQVRLADDDRAGVDQALDHRRGAARDVIAIQTRAVRRPDTGRVDEV